MQALAKKADTTVMLALNRCERRVDKLDPDGTLFTRLSSVVRKGFEKVRSPSRLHWLTFNVNAMVILRVRATAPRSCSSCVAS